MKKQRKYKVSSMLLATVFCMSNMVSVFGTELVDSIGSINTNDNGTNVGIDQTQNQKTEYTTEITEESKKDTLVYVSQASTFSVQIPKVIVLDGQTKMAEYLVSVSGNIGGEETINVVPEEKFNMSQEGKKDIEAIVTQDKTSWLYNEFATQGKGTISANDMTAGSWKGQFDFNIELKSNSSSNLKTFKISNNEYTCEENMTWEQWVSNRDDYYVLNTRVMTANIPFYVVDENDNEVIASNIIDTNLSYSTQYVGGVDEMEEIIVPTPTPEIEIEEIVTFIPEN